MRAESTIEPVDVASIASVVPELIKGWDELQFDDGAVVAGAEQERREGLRIVEGVHPHVGTKYRIVMVGPVAPASATETLWVELLAHNAESLRARFDTAEASRVTVDVDLNRPGAPRALTCKVGGRSEGNWLTRGTVTGEGRLSIDRFPPSSRSGPQLRAEFRHPHMRAMASMRIRQRHGDNWEVAVEIRAKGSGLVRPIAAVATPWIAGVLRRRLRASMATLPDGVRRFNNDWHVQITQAGARGVARRWLDEFLDAIPASVPDEKLHPR